MPQRAINGQYSFFTRNVLLGNALPQTFLHGTLVCMLCMSCMLYVTQFSVQAHVLF